MGIEAVGLIGFYGMLFTVFGVVEYVLGTVVMRELARRSASPDDLQEKRNLIRTTEIIYALFALVVGVAVSLAAPAIARIWLTSTGLDRGTVVQCLIAMGWTISLQLLFGLYVSALNGMERQIQSNSLTIFSALVRGVAALLVLLFVSATLHADFITQLLAVGLVLILAFFVVWHALPATGLPARFRFSLLRATSHYAPALAGNALVYVLILAADKLIVSALLPLDVFGYYIIASTIANLTWAVIGPVNVALVPRFTGLLANRGETGNPSSVPFRQPVRVVCAPPGRQHCGVPCRSAGSPVDGRCPRGR